MPKSYINFDGKSWTAVNDDIGVQIGDLTERERKRMSVPWRIWEISFSRMNNWGHAAFKPRELVTLVCGDDERSDKQAVARGIAILSDMGRIAPPGSPGSTVLCIVVNRSLVQRAAGKGGRLNVCSEPMHRDLRETCWPILSPAASVPAEPTALIHDSFTINFYCEACKALKHLDRAEVQRIHAEAQRQSAA